jgi:hypothetical protein
MPATNFTKFRFRTVWVTAAAVCGLAFAPQPSIAGGDVIEEYIDPVAPTEGRGCYYYRGREFCGTYCYWEINGKRYCTSRLRHAHSQAGPEHIYEAEPRPYRYPPRYHSGTK